MKFARRILLWCAGIAVLLALSLFVAHQFSPWPSALVYRAAMDAGGVGSAASMAKHVPLTVRSVTGESYGGGPNATFDIHYPRDPKLIRGDRKLPVIVWVHGGAFISGDKGQVANYLKILASRGYAAVGVNYALAPGQPYPSPVRQVNQALDHLARQAERLSLDSGRFILAGDSAGAQIAAQLATIVGSADYAKAVDIVPAISRQQLIGAILHCGIYDFTQIDTKGTLGGFLQSAGWSYFGAKDFKRLPAVAQASVTNHVTSNFPPTFISAGNADPLLPQSLAMADALAKQGIAVDRLFFPADHTPPLGHEYQFNLDTEAGMLALTRTLRFLSSLP